MNIRIEGETEDVEVEILGGGKYRIWADGFHDDPPYRRCLHWADVDHEGLLDALESILEPEEYAELLEVSCGNQKNAVA